jgi:transaldolase
MRDLNVQIYADGAGKEGLLKLYANPLIRGLTTNPTLMRKAGISDYEAFARDILQSVRDKPLSLEVIGDTFPEMLRQARRIASWQENVFVKIPVMNTQGESSVPVIEELTREGIKVNVTALLLPEQVERVVAALQPKVPAIVSIFGGRIADTGRDPEPLFVAARKMIARQPATQLLWGSVREVFNIFQADRCGCDIVTVPHDLLEKALKLHGMDLFQLSRETVQMFHDDAQASGYTL